MDPKVLRQVLRVLRSSSISQLNNLSETLKNTVPAFVIPKERILKLLEIGSLEDLISKVQIHGLNAHPQLKILSDSLNPHDKELTIYCRGFLSSDRFQDWIITHDRLVQMHGWSKKAVGWTWPSGRVLPIPPLLPPLPVLYKPAVLTVATALMIGGQIWLQWVLSQQRAVERARDLAEQLTLLRPHFDRIRIVSHSLGCRHVVEACLLLEPNVRPDYLHLCAPAFHDDDMLVRWSEVARRKTIVYYTPKDMLLQTVYRTFNKARVPFGIAPPETFRTDVFQSNRYQSVKVCDHFDLWVHQAYQKRFANFAVNDLGE
ncbi:conserved uncharacterized mitochondrial protein [Andalucia godoyi]|uniref:Conserved uncharacterized mitochondrial protein n=1 Tax=Andalucia godoyi TaxID=505711 RepID=A0A8K0F489_ANDGO|nr:conserved uncharacterized mitochondrial protein [Andalucia godoyi]|eukprot:ANDGO_06383.mRNA.1 conserved uncharacterized mitochondrial protein